MKDKLLCLFLIFSFVGFLVCRFSSVCHTVTPEPVKKVTLIDELYEPSVKPPLKATRVDVLPVIKTIESSFVLDKASGTLLMEGTIPSEQKDLLIVLDDFCHTFSCVNHISIEPLAKDAYWMNTLIPIINEFSNRDIEDAKLQIENGMISLYGTVKSDVLKQNIEQSIDLYANGMVIQNNLAVKRIEPVVKSIGEQNTTTEPIVAVIAEQNTTLKPPAEGLSAQDEETQAEINTYLQNHTILFRTGESMISSESLDVLDTVYGLLDKAQSGSITIEGHTDNRGDIAQNKLLSQQRADVIKRYFVEKGLDESKLTAVGYGSQMPLIKEDTKEAYRKNRRVEFHLN